MKQQGNAEYVARINRVLDHIEAHLFEKLSLEELARVASFSPFHFHRLFRAMVGEPLNHFLQRLRVERAASQLVYNPNKSITEVALDCGFSSSATFARAFKAFFEMSASEWRAGGHAEWRKIGKTDRKAEQTDSNPRKEVDVSAGYLDHHSRNLKWRIEMKTDTDKPSTMKTEVEVKQLPELHVAYVRNVGPYKGNADLFRELFGKLMRWAGPRGLIGPESKVLSVYHDDPEVTDEQKLRVSACLSIAPETEVEGEIGKMKIEAGQYAVARFELSADRFEEAWNAVYGVWLPQSGYQPEDRPAFELCHNNPDEHPEHKHIVDICVPVRPL